MYTSIASVLPIHLRYFDWRLFTPGVYTMT